MITALIIFHLFGGGSAEIFSSSEFKAVSRAIEDTERSETVTQVMERMNADFVTLLEMRARSFEKLSDIDHSVNTREGAYEAIIDELWQVRGDARKKYIEGIFIMRENMTREEWNSAFGISE